METEKGINATIKDRMVQNALNHYNYYYRMEILRMQIMILKLIIFVSHTFVWIGFISVWLHSKLKTGRKRNVKNET